jgi:hypothetical protein
MVENQRRNIAGMGITITNEATTLGRFEDRGFEHPKVLFGTAQCEDRLSVSAEATMAHGKTQQGSVADKRAFICSL